MKEPFPREPSPSRALCFIGSLLPARAVASPRALASVPFPPVRAHPRALPARTRSPHSFVPTLASLARSSSLPRLRPHSRPRAIAFPLKSPSNQTQIAGGWRWSSRSCAWRCRSGAMATNPRRKTKQKAAPSQMALPPRPARVGLPPVLYRNPQQFLMPRVEGEVGGGGVAGKRHRVLPPAVMGARSSQFVEVDDTATVTDEEYSGSMNSGNYFSNLMSNEFSYPMGYATREVEYSSQVDDTTLPNETPLEDDNTEHDATPHPEDIAAAQEHELATAKGTQGRTKNFRAEEDLLIVSAWLNVSMDGINGADQSMNTYWKRCHDYYHVNKRFSSDHTQGALMNRWSSIRRDVKAFCGCVSRIEARNQSGCSIDDKIASACALFKEDDKNKKNFQFMHCWKVLKDKPKWIQRTKHTSNVASKRRKAAADASPLAGALATVAGNVDGGQPSGSAQERPPGKKKEMQMIQQRASMQAVEYLVSHKKEADAKKDVKKEERFKKCFAMQEERNKIEKEKVEFKRQVQEERIMNIDMSTLNYKQQKYYEKLQDEILAKRLKN